MSSRELVSSSYRLIQISADCLDRLSQSQEEEVALVLREIAHTLRSITVDIAAISAIDNYAGNTAPAPATHVAFSDYRCSEVSQARKGTAT